MMTSFRDKLKKLVFGSPCFIPYGSHDLLARSGRFYIRVQWTDYRKRRSLPWQVILGSERKTGLLEVTMYFNPGMPAELFEAFLEMNCDESQPMIFVPFAEGFEGIEDVIDRPEDGELNDKLEWSCRTVLRTSADLMELHRWIERIRESINLDEHETKRTRQILSELTERYSTCRLNS